MKQKVLLVFLILFTPILSLTPASADEGLQLIPEINIAPYFTDESKELLIVVQLIIPEVTGLHSFSWEEQYDSEYLEYFSISLNPQVTAQSHGWSRSKTTASFGDYTFSGSGALLVFYFKPKAIGNSTLKIYDIKLYDSSQNLLVSGSATTEIRIIPYVEWVARENNETATEYLALQDQYEIIEEDYSTLNTTYLQLLTQFDEINSENTDLQSELTEQQEQYATMESSMDEMASNIGTLETELETIQTALENKSEGIPGFPMSSILIGGLCLILFQRRRNLVLS
jgi:hypothetical protein